MYFELQDSEVADCRWEEGCLKLRFSAACVWDNHAGQGQAAWAPVLLTAEQVEPWEAFAHQSAVGRLRQGWVLHASERVKQLPLPCDWQGVVTMELELAHGEWVHLRCQALQVQLLQGARVGTYQC